MVSNSLQLANNPSGQRVLKEQRDFFIRHVNFLMEFRRRVNSHQNFDANTKKNALIFKIN